MSLVAEGIHDPHAAEALAVPEILGEHFLTSGDCGGGEDERVPEGDPVTTAAHGSGQDSVGIDL